MALFRFTRETALPPAEAWRRLTTWERHGEAVPLTRVTVRTPPPTRVGTVFVARTALGPIGFDDTMEVVDWRPPEGATPGRCRLEKRGEAVMGWAEIEVGPGPVGSRIVWHEELRLRPLPSLFDGALSAVARPVFARVVTRLTKA
ncbi:SRPBCC family protein [Streptomyces sp. NPDC015345]|uniref:SRPBCC family protein n=1 Tax=Streptomyces sp. NPDC015345 TaxID=3364953 RepID=UPI0036FC24B7